MQLSSAAFNTFLSHIGQRFAWRRADACPCVSPHSGAASTTCLHCHGKGRIWSAPVQGLAGISGAKVQREWANFGIWESGDVVLTLPSDSALYAMGQHDRVVMVNSSSPFSLVLREGERLPRVVQAIDRVFWIDGAGAIVQGATPQVGEGGALSWPGGDGPPHAGSYTITGRAHQEYYCWGEYPQDRAHHSGQPLPRRVVLRRFDLYGRA